MEHKERQKGKQGRDGDRMMERILAGCEAGMRKSKSLKMCLHVALSIMVTQRQSNFIHMVQTP